jgi:hypothetical protein
VRRRRRGASALVLLVVIGGLLVAADVAARRLTQQELADRLAAEVPDAGQTSATIRSFPFLGRLAGSGHVPEVDASVTDVTVGKVRFASVAVVLHGVKLDRDQLVRRRKVILLAIERGEARAEVGASALSDALGVPLTLEDGKASVTLAGLKVGADVAVKNGRLTVAGLGITVPGLELVAPLLPCIPDAVVEVGRVVLSCGFTEVPKELRVAVQL